MGAKPRTAVQVNETLSAYLILSAQALEALFPACYKLHFPKRSAFTSQISAQHNNEMKTEKQ